MLLIQALAQLYLPALNADIIDECIAQGDNERILMIGALMLVVTVIMAVASVLAVYWGAKVAMGFGRDLRSGVFRKVESFSQVEAARFGSPSLITRNTNDVQQVQTVVFMGLTVMVTAPIMIVGGIIMAVREDGPLALLLVAILPAMALVIGVTMYRAIPLFQAMQTRIDRVNRMFAVTIPLLTAIMNLATVAVMWFGAMRINDGALQIGNLTAFLQYVLQIMFSVLTAVLMFILIPRAAVS